jgi:HNH endonuclease
VSVVSETIRELIVARAGSRCEYCRLPTHGQVATFPVDHIIPRSAGGETILNNLALACPHCNAIKWAHAESTDPETGLVVPLFHPRTDRWSEHFCWSPANPTLLQGLTPCGRATIACPEMNHPNLVVTRTLLAALGLFPDVEL